MKKLLSFLVLILAIVSCKKNDLTGNSSKKDYSYFLSQSGPVFYGKLDGVNFVWQFGLSKFQSISGYENGNGICDSIDPVRVVLYGLTSENGGQTRFLFYSPKYNTSSDADFLRVFSPGKKKLGDFRNDFYLSITKNNKLYQTNSADADNEIEVLKTEEFTDYLGKKLRVWFRLNAKLSSCNCQSSNSVLADGLMITEFYGFRK